MNRTAVNSIIAIALLLPALAAANPEDKPGISTRFLEPLGLFVAKLSVRSTNPIVLDAVYYHDGQAGTADHSRRSLSLEGDGPRFEIPGQFTLSPVEGSGARGEFTLAVTRTSETGLGVKVDKSGREIARGLAIRDPDNPETLLISGWTGETEPYGVAKYTITDDKTITGSYLSKMSPDRLGHDTAIGDTTDGFPGRYSLTTLEANGRTWGPHDWRLTGRGDLIDLVWREDGAVISRGFGLVDPENPKSIIVTYIAVGE